MTYIPLHVHSDCSLLDGLSQPKHIINRCKEIGSNACALTDHGTISGCVDFNEKMSDAKLKSILGVELYICNKDSHIKTPENRHLLHMVILAKNLQGWRNLVKLTTESNHPDNFYYKPRLDLNRLSKYLDGNIIGISGHLGSHIASLIFPDFSVSDLMNKNKIKKGAEKNWFNKCKHQIKKFKEMFGTENFFLETQLMDKNNIPAMEVLAEGLRYLSRKTNTPIVATPDAHYATHEQAVDQRVILCSGMKITMDQVQRKLESGEKNILSTFFLSHNYHIPTYEEMIEYGHTKEELENTHKIADMCEEYKLVGQPLLPKFPCPDGLSSKEYLRNLLLEGWKKRLPKIQKNAKEQNISEDVYSHRVKEEMSVLEEYNLTDYFLIVHDIYDYVNKQGWLASPGRGSAAGSIALYLLNITQIDPIKYGLLFERFLNKGRFKKDQISLPDVDMDFETRHRKQIIEYITEKYGKDKVAQVMTFTKMMGRGALKEVMRAYGTMSYDEMNDVCKPIPDEATISDHLQTMKEEGREPSIIMWALENEKEKLKKWAYIDDDGKIQGPLSKIFEQAIRLEGTKKSQSKHAAAVIVMNEPVEEVCPLIYDKQSKKLIIGIPHETSEKLGAVKLDILGVNSLDKCNDVITLLKYGKLN